MKTKAAVLRRIGGPLVIEELEVPKLEPGQVLVKIFYSGLCGSNLNEISGQKGAEFIPHLTGHEASGIVLELGGKVKKVLEGDHVVCSWIKGLGLDTPSVKYVNNKGFVNAGACATFTEYAVVSENRVVRISKNVKPEVAALLGCAVPTGAGVIDNEIVIKHNSRIAVFGIGGIGASALMRAVALNLDCTAFDILPWKLVWAKTRFNVPVINFISFDVTKVNLFDFVIECSGSKTAMEMAVSCLNNNGTLIITGNLKTGERITIDPFELIRGKKLQGTWGGRSFLDGSVPFYAGEYLTGKLPVDKLITKIYPLEEINNGLRDLRDGRLIRGVVKIG